MLKGKFILVAVASSLFVTGCASTDNNDASLFDRSVSGVSSAASSVGSAVSGLFAGYENGTKVEDKYLSSLVVGKTTTKDVEQGVGFPPEKEAIKGGVSWRYPYTNIPQLGANTNETTIFEFDNKGVLTKAYKANGRTDKTGNALIDSANGL